MASDPMDDPSALRRQVPDWDCHCGRLVTRLSRCVCGQAAPISIRALLAAAAKARR